LSQIYRPMYHFDNNNNRVNIIFYASSVTFLA